MRQVILVPSLLVLVGALAAAETAAEPAVPSPVATTTGDRLVVEGSHEAPDYRTESSSAALFGDRPLHETPFSVGAYDEALIEDQRAFTTAEVLRNDPSVHQSFPGGSYGYYDGFGIRGFAGDNWASYRVDGQPFANQGENAIENKERLEVLRGPAALRYGFAPPGGVVNYVRKRPTDAPSASLQWDGDQHGRLSTSADVGGRIGTEGAVGYRLVAAGERFDAFWNEADGQRTLLSALTDYRVSEDATVWLSYERNRRETVVNPGIPISVTGRVFDELPPETFLGADWARYETEQENLAVGADVRLHEDWLLRTASAHNDFARSDRRVRFRNVQDDGDYTVQEYWSAGEERPMWSHQTHIEGRFATGPVSHDLATGVSWRRLQAVWGDGFVADLGPSNVFAPVRYGASGLAMPATGPAFELEEFGLFLTDTITLNEQWSLLLGGRYARLITDERDTNTGLATGHYDDDALSPTAAVMFAPVDWLNTYALYSEGLQAGGIAPVGTTNAGELMPPLRSRQVEVGAKARLLDDRLELEAALFRIRQGLEYEAGGVYVQDGEQLHQGVEFTGRGRIGGRLGLLGGVMLLDAEQVETGNPAVDGRRTRGAPAWSATMWADYELPWVDGLALQAGANAVSERYVDNQERIEIGAYLRFDAGLRYRFVARDVTYTGRLLVENVTDEEYFVGGSYFGTNGSVFYGAPLTARLSLQVDL